MDSGLRLRGRGRLFFLMRRSCQSLEEELKKLVQVVDCVCADVQRAQNVYNKLFYRWASLSNPNSR